MNPAESTPWCLTATTRITLCSLPAAWLQGAL
jgi:hypothetical protein